MDLSHRPPGLFRALSLSYIPVTANVLFHGGQLRQQPPHSPPLGRVAPECHELTRVGCIVLHDPPMRHAVLTQHVRDLAEVRLVPGLQSNSESPIGDKARGTFTCCVDQLCCLETVREIAPNNAVVGDLGGELFVNEKRSWDKIGVATGLCPAFFQSLPSCLWRSAIVGRP